MWRWSTCRICDKIAQNYHLSEHYSLARNVIIKGIQMDIFLNIKRLFMKNYVSNYIASNWNINSKQCMRQVEVLGPKCSRVNHTNVFGISQQTEVSQPARRGLGFHAQAMTRLTKPESSANPSLRHEHTPPSHLELCHRERVKVYSHQVSMLSVKDRLSVSVPQFSTIQDYVTQF